MRNIEHKGKHFNFGIEKVTKHLRHHSVFTNNLVTMFLLQTNPKIVFLNICNGFLLEINCTVFLHRTNVF